MYTGASNTDRPNEFMQSEYLKRKDPSEGYDHPVEPRDREDAVEEITGEPPEAELARGEK
ncbi:MAG: hypothetical protein ABEJ64_02665 [Candidatus Nanohaloarchaea archaeon]